MRNMPENIGNVCKVLLVCQSIGNVCKVLIMCAKYW